MDILCPKCGEPYDMDCLHEQVEERWPEKYKSLRGEAYEKLYRKVAADFRARGCVALGSSCNGNKADERIGILYGMLGDDMDGAASMLDDMPLGDIDD